QIFPGTGERPATPPAPSPRLPLFPAATALSRHSPSDKSSASPAVQPASRLRPDLRALQSPQIPSLESPVCGTAASPADAPAPLRAPPRAATPARSRLETSPPPPTHCQIHRSPLRGRAKTFPAPADR